MIGTKENIGFELTKISDEQHVCELRFYIRGRNICEWTDLITQQIHTVRWNLDDLIGYLEQTIRFLYGEDDFPVPADGECAAEMDNNARDFESDDEELMLQYYEKLDDWVYRHSWNHARAGAVVPDVLFRRVGDSMEVSWWSDQEDEGRQFTYPYGFCLVPAGKYEELIKELAYEYKLLWVASLPS